MKHMTGIRGAVVLSIVGVAMVGCSDANVDTTQRDTAGAITSAGEVGVFKLAVGDCIPKSEFEGSGDPTATSEVEHLDAVPCTQPHAGEVVLVDEQFFASSESMPSVDDMSSQADQACVKAIEDYTGQAYETSPYVAEFLIPTADSWAAAEDRGLVCLSLTIAGDGETLLETTGSIRAAQ